MFIVGTHISSLCQPDEALLWLRVCNLLTPLALVFFFFLSGYGLMTQLRLRTSVHLLRRQRPSGQAGSPTTLGA